MSRLIEGGFLLATIRLQIYATDWFPKTYFGFFLKLQEFPNAMGGK